MNSLQIRDEGIFKSIINWIKGFFKSNSEPIKEETNTNININIKYNNSNDFMESIRVVEDNKELLEKQRKFENGEFGINDISKEEIEELNKLYDKQIKLMVSQIENKKNELNSLRNRRKAIG